ncbi:GntR family transcriptional regulator [Microbacterium sp. NPDC091313]
MSETQSSRLYTQVREAILSLDIVPGERLSERGLEAQYGASRTPAHAALMRLESDGLVQRQGRGWVVAPIDVDELKAVAQYREVIETAAVRAAVERASDADLDGLAELLESAGPIRDEEDGVRSGGDFHVELAALSGNPFFVDGVRTSMTRLARTRWLEVQTPEARASAWEEHRAIVRAMRERDVDGAAARVSAHIRATNDRLLARLAEQRRPLRIQGVAVIGSAN